MSSNLYSTNVFLKYHIQQHYRGDIHYVWCSDGFDSATVGRYTAGALVPNSSNPANVYRELKKDVETQDNHSAKIAAQKATLTRLATKWEKAGEITSADRTDSLYMIKYADFAQWRPLLYVIPFESVRARVKTVPMSKRAGLGPEYTIEDLRGTEFDIVEF